MAEISDRRLLAALVFAVWLHVGVFAVARDWTANEPRPPRRTEPLRVEIVRAPAPVPAPLVVSAPPPPRIPTPRRAPAPSPAPREPRRPDPAPEVESAALEAPAAPAVAAAAPATRAATAPQAASAEHADSYLERVGRMIEAQRRYPHAARRRRLEAVVVLRLTIAGDGSVRDAHTLGDAPRIFERASLAAVADAAPFPSPPAGFDEMEIAIRYEIDR